MYKLVLLFIFFVLSSASHARCNKEVKLRLLTRASSWDAVNEVLDSDKVSLQFKDELSRAMKMTTRDKHKGSSNPCSRYVKFATNGKMSEKELKEKIKKAKQYNKEKFLDKVTDYSANKWSESPSLDLLIKSCLNSNEDLGNVKIQHKVVNNQTKINFSIDGGARHITLDPNNGYVTMTDVSLNDFDHTRHTNVKSSLFFKDGECITGEEAFNKEKSKLTRAEKVELHTAHIDYKAATSDFDKDAYYNGLLSSSNNQLNNKYQTIAERVVNNELKAKKHYRLFKLKEGLCD